MQRNGKVGLFKSLSKNINGKTIKAVREFANRLFASEGEMALAA
jgi:hypothetical protein